MSQTQIIAQVKVTQVAKRGRKPNTAVQAICQEVVASTKTYRYVADLVRQAKAQMGNGVASDATVRKYILLAMEGAAKKIKKELTAEEKAVNTIINLQVGNVVRSGTTNINDVAFALSQKMAEKGINRNKGQVVRLLKKKEIQIAKDRAKGVIGKNGKIPAEMGLTRNPVGRPKKKK